mmetsp:Transcript_3205/g.8374  ORF Transcript_3205/g.8374 Transcript_3205/m.8374 type:complete len:195 (-) Transcript_3205:627-1211(-)
MGATDSSLQNMPAQQTPAKRQHHRVQLAITPLGAQVPGMPAAYHTSISIDDVEYTFSRLGVTIGRNWGSHRCIGGKGSLGGPGVVLDCGTTSFSGRDMLKALRPHFQEGTYDLLKKNCNSFSDCALYFLLGRRLDGKYAALEQFAASADKSIGLVQFVSRYSPNPKAEGFQVGQILARIPGRRSTDSAMPIIAH